ncbi:GGDEF domain-containing protein [Candidatus Woesearchaeota archaeon]|nr:GGDEF domain-containing protein [Candidatus Woesearchaeota archaeon]
MKEEDARRIIQLLASLTSDEQLQLHSLEAELGTIEPHRQLVRGLIFALRQNDTATVRQVIVRIMADIFPSFMVTLRPLDQEFESVRQQILQQSKIQFEDTEALQQELEQKGMAAAFAERLALAAKRKQITDISAFITARLGDWRARQSDKKRLLEQEQATLRSIEQTPQPGPNQAVAWADDLDAVERALELVLRKQKDALDALNLALAKQRTVERIILDLQQANKMTADALLKVIAGFSKPSEFQELQRIILRHKVALGPEAERVLNLAGTFAVHRTEHVETEAAAGGIDFLTQVPNRRTFLQLAEPQLSLARRNRWPAALLVVDIDHFKGINDTYGHDAGDRALALVARIMHENVRTSDIVGRWGGEEFVVFLPNTDKIHAAGVAEHLRTLIADKTVTLMSELRKGEPGRANLTVSIGVAAFPDNADGFNQLFSSADTALYQAKNSGRNRVVSSATA